MLGIEAQHLVEADDCPRAATSDLARECLGIGLHGGMACTGFDFDGTAWERAVKDAEGEERSCLAVLD